MCPNALMNFKRFKNLHGCRLSKKAKNKKFYKDAMLMSLAEVILEGIRHWLKYQNGILLGGYSA